MKHREPNHGLIGLTVSIDQSIELDRSPTHPRRARRITNPTPSLPHNRNPVRTNDTLLGRGILCSKAPCQRVVYSVLCNTYLGGDDDVLSGDRLEPLA